jgi:type III secretion protein R
VDWFAFGGGRPPLLVLRGAVVVGLVLAPGIALGATSGPTDALSPFGGNSTLAVLGLLSVVPLSLLLVTAFVKISTVLHILRGALGAPAIPSSSVVFALATALTFLAMAPVTERVVARVTPVLAVEPPPPPLRLAQLLVQAVDEPLREFLDHNASDKEKARFAAIAQERTGTAIETAGPLPFPVLVPAFVITELGKAFSVGFLLYLPFLVLDLVIANVMVAVGLAMVNPAYLSLPFKLLLFVAIDGWGLLAQALVLSYRR